MKPAIIKRNNKTGYVYRIIIRYYDEYDNLVSKETSYKPEPGMTEAKAEVYAELYAEQFQKDLLEKVEKRKKEIAEVERLGGPLKRMTFKELAQEWLDSKYDSNNPANPNNISYRYYCEAITEIANYNKEFGDMRVVDITHDVIYKYYKKLSSMKKVSTIYTAKPNIKEIFKARGLSKRVVYSLFSRIPFNLSAILNGANVQEKTALKLSQAVGIPLNKLFDKKVKEEAYAEYTIFGKKKILKTIFEFAINVLRIIHENPAKDGMTKNSFQTKRRESLSEEQAIQFYEATKEFDIMIQTAMHMSLLTGMRPAEMGGLEWKDIDFSYKTITIERNAIKCDKMGIILKGTKTNKARTISIPEILVEQLIKYRKWQQDWIESLGDYYKDDDQVFSQSDGSRVTTDIFNKWFKKVRDKAELPEKFTLYNLRHTNLSILVGYVPITTVAQRAGHSTIKTTEEYYIHRVSEADMQASQTLNNVFKTSFENQTKGKEEIEIEEYKRSLEKMKQLGFKTLKEYFEYLNYMKSKGFNIPL